MPTFNTSQQNIAASTSYRFARTPGNAGETVYVTCNLMGAVGLGLS